MRPFCKFRMVRPTASFKGSFYCIMLLACVMGGSSSAQPPGTQPPQELLNPSAKDTDSGIPIRAFMFLTESGNPVLMPSLTWEEFERYLNLDAGIETSSQQFSYQALEIIGTALGNRAELEVGLKLSVDATAGSWVSVPIKLGNFHLLEPIRSEPLVEVMTTVSADGSGYRVFFRSDKRTETTLVMRFSAKIDGNATLRNMSFRLPDVPTKVSLVVDEKAANADVIGQGDEIIQLGKNDSGQMQVSVESSGGEYTVRWGSEGKSEQTAPIYEVDSRATIRWDSPQDPLNITVRLNVNNIRGAVKEFDLSLPKNAILIETPSSLDSGQEFQLGPIRVSGDVQLRKITLPSDIQQQRVDFGFEYQLDHQNASRNEPLQFVVPSVQGSLRHRGELDFLTPTEYRLRWRSSSWVRRLAAENTDEAVSNRLDRFAFDRSSFVLPLWLSENKRQLRITSRSEITTRESNVTLWMQVEISGETEDGLIRFDDAGWEVRVVESQLGTPLTTLEEEGDRVVDISALTTEEASQLLFQFQRVLNDQQDVDTVSYDLPRILAPNTDGVVRDSTLELINDGRSILVVDLEASRGLTRSNVMNTGLANEATSYRLIDGEYPARLEGLLVEQPTQITLASDTSIELDGELLTSSGDWVVSSILDLEGRLAVRIPDSVSAGNAIEEGTSSEADENNVEPNRLQGSPWTVTVDEVPAELRHLGEDRYVLISDRLTSGTMRVRFRGQQQISVSANTGDVLEVSFPRPAVTDVTMRGPVIINLQADQQRRLVLMDQAGEQSLEFPQIPREPLRLRLATPEKPDKKMVVGPTVLRSVLGSSVRHDQILAKVTGGNSYEFSLRVDPALTTVKCFLDGQLVGFERTGNKLVVPLATTANEQLIDVRVWSPTVNNTFFNELNPLVEINQLSQGAYWQIVVPIDTHAIWASHVLGRLMSWRYDRWKLYRDPSYSDQALLDLVSSDSKFIPEGNRYLYRGMATSDFKVCLLSRVGLWMIAGSFVIAFTSVVTMSRTFRHPTAIMILAILLSGICLIAPDGAILVAQFSLLAMLLVIVMLAVRVLAQPNSARRILSASSSPFSPVASSPGSQSSHVTRTLELVENEDEFQEGADQ